MSPRILWFASAILVVIVAVSPLSGQTRSIDFSADGGGMVGRAATVESGAPGARAAWFAGISADAAPLPLGGGWDMSAAAALRREPTLGMARAGTRIAAAYLDAVAASFSLAFAHAAGPLEAAVVGRIAGTRIDSSQRVEVAANTIGAAAFFADARVDLRWDRPRIHASRRSRQPVVDVYLGVKHDQRFHRAGDLAGFDDPTGRVEAGFSVAPWRLTEAAGDVVMAAVFGVAGETALRGGERLPSGVRAWAGAQVDLRDLFNRFGHTSNPTSNFSPDNRKYVSHRRYARAARR